MLADLGREGGVGFSKGVLLAALPAGGSWVAFCFGREFDVGSCVIDVLHFGALGVLKAAVGEVAVGFELNGRNVFETTFVVNPVDLSLLEVGFRVVLNDVLHQLVDLDTSLQHSSIETALLS